MKNFTKFVLYRQNLIDNFEKIKAFTNSKICAMIKADGYGYGMINVANILKEYVDFFGVANGVEALLLRKKGIKTSILICGTLNKYLMPKVLKNNISFSCSSFKFLVDVERRAKKLNLIANIHIKINSGMNRLGVKSIDEFIKMVHFAQNSEYINLEGIFTHTGFSECQEKSNLIAQHDKFLRFLNSVQLENVIIHFANSGAFCYDKSFHHDMVRIGKLLYGVNASFSDFNFDLKPVFALKTKIIQKQVVALNEFIGYKDTLKANEQIMVGILPIGYGDGFLSEYSGCSVIIKNKKFLILSVCMDLTIIKIDDSINENDDVLLLGIDNNNIIPVTHYSENSHNIPSQVVANLNKNRFDIFII